MKKKLLKLVATSVLWGVIYWGVSTSTESSWLNLLVIGAFISSIFVIIIED
jgi:hypothetical protein